MLSMNATGHELSANMSALGLHPAKHTQKEVGIVDRLETAFSESRTPVALRLSNFAKFARRQDIARFLTRYELFKLAQGANGSIVECGVFAGGGLMGWMHFSASMEPYNHTRRIIGFDTFTGFPSLHLEDAGTSENLHVGAYSTHDSIEKELRDLISIHDSNRPIGHIPKVELVGGDATKTIKKYVDANPHLLISLLYLDFDLYEPTKAALEYLLPRVVKGGVVAFDELNCGEYPGETTALRETVDIGTVPLQRMNLDPYISYFIK
jgi:hypothetical protein